MISPNVDLLFGQAVEQARSGRLDQAQQKCREILNLDPEHVQANLMLGIAAARSGREGEATTRLNTVLEQEPQNYEALKWMAAALNRLRRFEEAVAFARRAVAIRPDDYTAQLALAQALVGNGQVEQSLDAYVSAVRIEPRREGAYRGAFDALMASRRRLEARSLLTQMIKFVPSPWAFARLAELSLDMGSPEQAAEWAEKVPAGTPEEEGSLVVLAAAWGKCGNLEKESKAFSRLEAISPKNQFVPMLRGASLQLRGKFEEAEQELLKAIELDPKFGDAYQALVTGRRIVESDLPLVHQIESILEAGGLTPKESGPLHFALGKAYEDFGRYGEAMEHFVEGNRQLRAIRVGPRPFDRKGLEEEVDRTIDLFTKDFLKSHRDQRTFQPVPILIAGAMRSGTTLLEQILSCHPRVAAGGEQTFWRIAAKECLTLDPFDPEAGVHHDVIRKKALDYVRSLRKLAGDREFVTDKEPGNHSLFGIISLALPNSPFIQMRRNLADIALSTFTTLYQTAEEYVWDRDDIVFALKQHARLEKHWRKVLPPERFLEVDYQELATDPEPVLRRVLEFCGLEWNDACLRSEHNDRVVTTPSFWQVRQPVNPRSVDRWKRYEGHLGPFEELVS